MSLPEIPDEAVLAADQFCVCAGACCMGLPGPHDLDLAREQLERAWPHLYAAALRHAASRIDRRTAFDPGMRGIEAALVVRRLADEASPVIGEAVRRQPAPVAHASDLRPAEWDDRAACPTCGHVECSPETGCPACAGNGGVPVPSEAAFPGWDDLTTEQKAWIADETVAAFWRGYNYEPWRADRRPEPPPDTSWTKTRHVRDPADEDTP